MEKVNENDKKSNANSQIHVKNEVPLLFVAFCDVHCEYYSLGEWEIDEREPRRTRTAQTARKK